MNRQARKSRGFTLVELLVALALGLMLSAGIVNIYLQNKRNYLQDEEVARLQENARYALNLLKRELTMAGFVGSLADYDELTPVAVGGTDCIGGGNWALDVAEVFELINDVDSSAALTTLNGTTWTCLTADELLDGTDLISLKRTADSETLDDGALPAGVTEDDEQWYLRTEDNNASMGWAWVGAGATIPAADKVAGNGTDYWEYYNKIYYIREYSRSAGDGVPTLCVESLQGNSMTSECLVEGVEDLQIEVGIDTNDDSVPDQFKAAPSASEIEEAVAVRIYLLVRSVNDLSGYTNAKSYQLGSKAVAAKNDGFVRRVFTTTIQMRNAKLPNA